METMLGIPAHLVITHFGLASVTWMIKSYDYQNYTLVRSIPPNYEKSYSKISVTSSHHQA